MNMKYVGGVLAVFVFLMPISFADASASSSAQGEAKVSAIGLRMGHLGHMFGDFAFNVKSAFAFSQKAKLEVLKSRNEEMNSRQQAWVEAKQQALAQFNSTNMTAGQKQSILDLLKSEHDSIVKARLELTGKIKEVKTKAKAENDTSLESDAEEAAEASASGNSAVGLDADFGGKAEVHEGAETRGEIKREENSRDHGVEVSSKVNLGVSLV